MLHFSIFLKFAKANLISLIIQIGGLSLGLASCVIMSLYVFHELNYDAFWEDYSKIWRIDTVESIPGRTPIFVSGAPASAGELMLDNFQEFEDLTRVFHDDVLMKSENDTFNTSLLIADSNFISFMGLPIILGEQNDVINDNNSVAISQKMAFRFFGTENPINKIITFLGGNNRQYRITSIFKDLPENSHFRFDAIIRLHRNVTPEMEGAMNNWGNPSFKTYVKIRDKALIEKVERRFPDFLVKYFPADFAAAINMSADEFLQFKLIPLTEVHMYGADLLTMKPRANILLLQVFTFIAIVVLSCSSFNYANLSVSLAIKRNKEVAIRKVLGAGKSQILKSFLLESVINCIISFIIAIFLVEILSILISAITLESLPIDIYGNVGLLGLLLFFTILLSLIIGIYPASVMSKMKPSKVLHSLNSSSTSSAKIRNILTFLQFIFAGGLIVVSLVVLSQISFIQNFDHKFKTENIAVISDVPNPEKNISLLREALLQFNNIEMVGSSSFIPLDASEHNVRISLETQPEPFALGYREIGEGFFETYNVKPVEGRLFDITRDAGLADNLNNIIINMAAVKKLGFLDAQDAIGKALFRGSNKEIIYVVIGVIDNIYLNSIHREIRDEIYVLSDKSNVISIAYDEGSIQALTENFESIWNRLLPDYSANLQFMETIVEKTYRNDVNSGLLISILAVVSVFISSLGLYAIAAISVQKSIKEIVVRKIFGATTFDSIKLLLIRILYPVIVANLVAWPIAYIFASDWLSNFTHNISIGIHFFLIGSFLNVLIAIMTVTGHVWRASQFQPAEILRQE